MNTPWGQAQTKEQLGFGVIQVTTAGHGGIHVSPTRNVHVHPVWRNKGGWYEEDCAWAIVAVTFPDLFTEEHRIIAHRVAKDWFPDAYERVFAVQLLPAESYQRREDLFYRDNADRFIAVAAWSSDNSSRPAPIPAGMVGVLARRGGTANPGGPTAYFLVREGEYSGSKFVINEERHADWQVPVAA